MQNPKYIMNKLIIIIKLKEIINLIKSPWFKILYKKYINPLKDVKQEKKPLNKIFSVETLNLLLIKKPTKNDPIIEIKKLLVLDVGTTLSVLRNWEVSKNETWVRVELASNKFLDDPNKILKGWIRI